jgi:hypothetical protein
MDMDIQLKSSRMLCLLRGFGVICAVYALMISRIPTSICLLLFLVISLKCLWWFVYQVPIGSFVCELEKLTDSGDTAAKLNLSIKLSDGRWLQVYLTSFYCLWWIQILEFRSASTRHTLIVLPDSCECESRRRLRSLLLSGQLRDQCATE